MMIAGEETFEQRVERLRLRTKEARWKGPRSVPVADATWRKALEFVNVAIGEARSEQRPFVSPGESGTIYLSWRSTRAGEERDVVDVEISPSGRVSWERDGADGFSTGDGQGEAMQQVVKLLTGRR